MVLREMPVAKTRQHLSSVLRRRCAPGDYEAPTNYFFRVLAAHICHALLQKCTKFLLTLCTEHRNSTYAPVRTQACATRSHDLHVEPHLLIRSRHRSVSRSTLPLPVITMLKRIPTTKDGKPLDRLQESRIVNKPFKPPTIAASAARDQPQRKRKRVSYKDQDGAKDDDDSDDEAAKRRKKKKQLDESYHNEEELLAAVKKFPVYKPKPFGAMHRRFSMPTMRNKAGEAVALVPTGASLGIRPLAKLIPRPLFDPMADHAIVLYDPTIDDRETDEERLERVKEEEKARMEEEARAKSEGMYNPHKKLRTLLGEDKKGKTKSEKVPVVIDPRLGKVLRPHQVEGVKVRGLSAYLNGFLTAMAVPLPMRVRDGHGEHLRLHYGR